MNRDLAEERKPGFMTWLLSSYFILIVLDGIFRFVAFKTHLSWINYWKDVFLLVVLCVGSLKLWTARRDAAQECHVIPFALTWGLLALGWLGIFYGMFIGRISLIQGVWGFKILYLPICLFMMVQMMGRSLGRDYPERIMNCLFVISMPLVVLGVGQFLTGRHDVAALYSHKVMGGPVSSMGGFVRAFSTFRNPFAFGDFCAMLFIFNTAWLVLKKSRRKFYFLVEFFLLIGIFISTSRVAMLMAVVGVLFIFKVAASHIQKRKVFLIASLISLILLMVVWVGAYHQHIGVAKGHYLKAISSSTSLVLRKAHWEKVFRDHPLDQVKPAVFGFGTGAVGAAQRVVTLKYYFVDNFYFLILVCHGVLGLVIWCGFLAAAYKNMAVFIDNASHQDHPSFWFIVGMAALLISFLFGFLFRTCLEGFPTQIYFWGFLGLAGGIIQASPVSQTREDSP